MRRIQHCVWGLAGLLLLGCTQPSGAPVGAAASASASATALPPELAAKVLAKVGDRTITLGDYAAVLERMDRFERLRYQSPERRRLLLDEIIRAELLAGEARRRGLDRSPEAAERTRQVLRDELLLRLRAGVPSPEQIPEGEVRAYYQAHADEFREPERRRVAAIVLPSARDAEAVLKQAERASPTQWGELVRARATEPVAEPLELAGDLGIVSLGKNGESARVPEPVRQAVFQIAEVGKVFDRVVPADGRFYVVRLIGRTEARARTYEEAQRSIRVTLVQERIRAAEQKLEQELRQRFPVKIDDAALAAVSVPAASPADAGSDAAERSE
jgi:peptidyl-prolyl cis-trans isomerase C